MTLAPVRRKWRPTLGQIVFAVLTTVMALPLIGLFAFRLYDNQLIRQTEAELIAQSTVLAAVFAREVEARIPSGIALGQELPVDARPGPPEPFSPIKPDLDLAGNDLLGRRPDAHPAAAPPAAAYLDIGATMLPLLRETQKVTLAGFRLLDPAGTVIAGRDENGLSLAHVAEVAAALQGHYRSALRIRTRDKPPPPIYSISRGAGLRVFSAMPVIVQNHVAGVIYASRTPRNIFEHLYEERGKFALAALAVLGVTLLIGLVFSRTVTRPMHELISRSADIGRGDSQAFRPLSHYGTREFALLSQSFLDMAEQLSRRSNYIATFAAHLTHELKSPLTSIRGAAELLQDSSQAKANALTDAEQSKFLANILSDTERLETMAHRLRELARAENLPQDGATTLAPVIGQLRSTFTRIKIYADGALDRTVSISPENALIILSHLADNAVRHNAGNLRIAASEHAGHVIAIVSNDGDAISEHNRTRVFDTFFTTRRDSGGTGMGLAIVQSMLRAHGGEIRLLAPEHGVAFEIQFPGM
jgi:two-component system, OmpR family, sensor histidine kinase CreC